MIDTTKTIGTPTTFDQVKIRNLLSKGTITNITNLEKAIFSLEYLGQLHEEGLEFIFKGGSATQILLNNRWTRLSIDIDICIDSKEEELQTILEKIYHKFDKEAFSYNPRSREMGDRIPFYFYTIDTPAITESPRTILLDAVGIKPKIATQQTLLETFFFESKTKITTPTAGSLLGDKLTTIGPKTIGRPLKDSRNGLEYAKHFHDINSLQENIFSFKECKLAFKEAMRIQSIIRNKDYTPDQCFSDMLFTCQVASLPQRIGKQAINKLLPPSKASRATSEYRILQNGLQRFRPFLVRNLTYTWDDIRYYAARTALLIKMINSGQNEKNVKKILNTSIPNKTNEILNLLKQIEKIPKEKRWFIIPEEIKNFPKILKTWLDYFVLSEII